MTKMFQTTAKIATIMTLVVVVLGAWVRLSDAGLGCPDWPGCYGELIVPADDAAVARANEAYPERPLEQAKAWPEMIHRYFAGALGMVIFGLAFLAWRNRDDPKQPTKIPYFLVVLIVFQALLGMWTVTLLLKPVIVMSHLLGGISTLALLAWLSIKPRAPAAAESDNRFAGIALLGLIVLFAQIALGGWVSSNYAALACPDLPTCQNEWWPEADFAEGFVLWRGLGVDYEGGVLQHPARIAIHLAHRIGALVTLLLLGAVAVTVLMKAHNRQVVYSGFAVAALLLLQIALGLAIIRLALPLPLAAAHNAVAALLLLSVVSLNRTVRPREVK